MQTLLSLIADYIEFGKYEKQLSPDTIKVYRIDLRQFLEFVGAAQSDKGVLNRYIKITTSFPTSSLDSKEIQPTFITPISLYS